MGGVDALARTSMRERERVVVCKARAHVLHALQLLHVLHVLAHVLHVLPLPWYG
jgi:hypothetical protein